MRLLSAIVLSCFIAACDSSTPPPPLDLLTAGRWNEAGFEVVSGSNEDSIAGFGVPVSWEFGTNGIVRVRREEGFPESEDFPFVLNYDATMVTLYGTTATPQGSFEIEVEALTASDLVLRYSVSDMGRLRVQLQRRSRESAGRD